MHYCTDTNISNPNVHEERLQRRDMYYVHSRREGGIQPTSHPLYACPHTLRYIALVSKFRKLIYISILFSPC